MCGPPSHHFDSAPEVCLSLVFLEYVAEFCHEVAGGHHVDVHLAAEDFLKAWRRFCEIYRWDWQCCFCFHGEQLIRKACHTHQTESRFELFTPKIFLETKNTLQ